MVCIKEWRLSDEDFRPSRRRDLPPKHLSPLVLSIAFYYNFRSHQCSVSGNVGKLKYIYYKSNQIEVCADHAVKIRAKNIF
jgi:hypothetical protein